MPWKAHFAGPFSTWCNMLPTIHAFIVTQWIVVRVFAMCSTGLVFIDLIQCRIMKSLSAITMFVSGSICELPMLIECALILNPNQFHSGFQDSTIRQCVRYLHGTYLFTCHALNCSKPASSS